MAGSSSSPGCSPGPGAGGAAGEGAPGPVPGPGSSSGGSAGSTASNPRKFSEKIALHNQKQAEETAAFEEVMKDLNVSRVQFHKLHHLRLAQTRAQYYGGSLPNVNQIGNNANDLETSLHPTLDSARGTRHHGLVERVHRDRSHMISPRRRQPAVDKHGRQIGSSPYGSVYLSPPPDASWRRSILPWGNEEKPPGLRLISALSRTNSDSALHTSALNPNPQDAFMSGNQLFPQQDRQNVNYCDEMDSLGEVFSFPVLTNEDSLLKLNKPLPKQLWEAKKVQSLLSRPKSCEVPGISIYPSPDQNVGLLHFQGSLNTGGSLPDLTNLHFPSPLPTPLDPEDSNFPNISGGSSTSNLAATMTQLGISNSQGLSTSLHSSLSNPSIQASLSNSVLQSPLNNHSLSNPSIHSSLRSSLSNPSIPTALKSSPRRRQTPVSPLTLSPGMEPRRSMSKQFSPTMSPTLSSIAQGVALDTSNMTMEHLPPYPLYQQLHQSQHKVQHPQGQSPVSPLHHLSQQSPIELHSPTNDSLENVFSDPCFGQHLVARNTKPLSQQVWKFAIHRPMEIPSSLGISEWDRVMLEQFNMLENPVGSLAMSGNSFYNPGPSLHYSQASSAGLTGSLQDPSHLKPNLPYSTCTGNIPNIILTGDSPPSLSKDISSALAGVPDMTFDSDGQFQLDDELKIEPLSLDGLSMLSDPDLVLADPAIEDTFRTDRV
ncbi:CREB-regulated transcription coactivator 3 isoform X1 [Rhincodon typus]|uniref:CREB-regulated transcription coactivator 3 isoform X1 n=1 Tax=Rhincodon typus TaxID=259920 RepID=UPI0009A424AF|nr:CREB-regulated transcription coactivator 3 isoform X1 [Rhincodon typus]